LAEAGMQTEAGRDSCEEGEAGRWRYGEAERQADMETQELARR